MGTLLLTPANRCWRHDCPVTCHHSNVPRHSKLCSSLTYSWASVGLSRSLIPQLLPRYGVPGRVFYLYLFVAGLQLLYEHPRACSSILAHGTWGSARYPVDWLIGDCIGQGPTSDERLSHEI